MSRVLLAHNSTYYPSSGGGDKSNRLLMEALAARGHDVRVVARVERFGESGHAQFLRDLAARSVRHEVIEPGAVRFSRNGVDVRTLTLDTHWRAFFSAQLDAFQPEVIITSTDDPAQLLFDLAVKSQARVMYLVRATIAVPFGPESSSVSAERTAKLRQADAAVGVSQYVANYCRTHGGLDAVHVPISLLEPGTPNRVGRFENPYVTMANPCAVKGIDIFLGVADRLPEVRFAAVPMWGTTTTDRAQLLRRPNVRLLEPFDNIDDLLALTRVMLVPSVWHEARSRMIVESMSRGVPVVASDVGGIHEAMMGVDYLLPVNAIEHYQPSVDEHMVPVAQVPPQNVEPWVETVRTLCASEPLWNALSDRSLLAALDYMRHLTAEPFEALMFDLLKRPKKPAISAAAGDRKKLLALMLKQRQAASNPWLPVTGAPPRLVCFPFAGAGTGPFRQWTLPVSTVPLLLPGRETRQGEPPIEDMASLVSSITAAIEPLVREPFAFFGHSMGAVVAYETARELRRRGLPMPVALFAAGARAPHFRRNWTPPPEPSEQEFLDELRRLEGLSLKVLDNPELLRLALPALRADARLYRNYVYAEDAPLPVRIFAYGGVSDPNVAPGHVEAWREHTTGGFEARIFAGGHFFIDTARDEFLRELSLRLRQAGLSK